MKQPKTVRVQVRATIEYEPDNYVSLKQERQSWLGTLGEINEPGECWGLKRLRVECVPTKRRKPAARPPGPDSPGLSFQRRDRHERVSPSAVPLRDGGRSGPEGPGCRTQAFGERGREMSDDKLREIAERLERASDWTGDADMYRVALQQARDLGYEEAVGIRDNVYRREAIEFKKQAEKAREEERKAIRAQARGMLGCGCIDELLAALDARSSGGKP